ncbi:low molecular weight phosphotyrosine protein phosphatase [Agrococcus sp. SL85]|uniref:low molecular weight protein-tyrosine-phosphatase n=1 Tax=Agrococcus sp. SL85 TaxID=2995141 RepID=UPI00226D327B|nr:low molecular weight protein-tyrosine-phosphatase [Agrococcus sp. SL85]WAC66970.1 low molecular weight phosphotyrosine protein phosphatase [Agrococcus sp. SL85]
MTIDRAFADATRFRVAFVCTGNICRSPMAASAFERLAQRHGVAERLLVTSAGISEYHVGETADPRTLAVLAEAGYDASAHRAKQFKAKWFDRFDLVIAFDRGQERALRSLARTEEQQSKIRLLLSFDPDATGPDVPDPYYSEDAFFGTVLRQIETAVGRLFRQIQPALRS